MVAVKKKLNDWLPTGARALLAKKDGTAKGTVIRCPMPGSARGSFLDLSSVAKAAKVDKLVAFMRTATAPEASIALARDALVQSPDAGDLVQSWTLSTARIDSYKDSIDPDGWDLGDYRRNPVVLFAHKQDELPVGSDLGAWIDKGSALKGVTRFFSAALNPFGNTVGKLVGAKGLNTTSVGFEPDDYEIAEDRDGLFGGMFPAVNFKKQRLREYSVVPVPANADALADGRAIAGLSPDERKALVSWCEKSLDLAGEGPLFVARSVLEAVRKDAGGSPRVYALAPGIVAVRAPAQGARIAFIRADVEPEQVQSGPPKLIPLTTSIKCPTCGHTAPVSEFTNKTPDGVNVATDTEAKCPSCGAHFEVAQALNAVAAADANPTAGGGAGPTNTSASTTNRDGAAAPTSASNATTDEGQPLDDATGEDGRVDEAAPASCPQCGFEGTVADFVLEPMPDESQIQMAAELPTRALVEALKRKGALEEVPDAGGGVDGGSSTGDPSTDIAERVAKVATREVRRQVMERTGRLP